MKILTLTTLYPNSGMPNHGVFVENRLRALVADSGAEVRVIAPVPYFPSKNQLFGRYAKYAAVTHNENRHGIEVTHPRYFIPPKVGMTYAATALKRCFLREAQKLLKSGFDFDVIDAHYLYPDGVAAVEIANTLNKPVVLTARGTDVSLIPSFPKQRAMILNAVHKAESVICVAAALRDELIALGAPAEKLIVLRNGVDLETFRPKERRSARARFAIKEDAHLIASVGHLIDRKGHDLIINALASLPDVILAIAGDGDRKAALNSLAQERDVADRVHFLGAIPHDELADLYSAADILALGSSREGWPNVLLEAMACGTPAVAAPIWGCGEVITNPAAGRLTSDRSAAAFAQTLSDILKNPPSRAETRAFAEQYSWDNTAKSITSLFTSIITEEKKKQQIYYRPAVTSHPHSPPQLLVTVDTEEAFDWNEFEANNDDVCNTQDINRFQTLCEKHEAKPLYFLTHPILADKDSAAYFKDMCQRETAEAGLHMHQWVTPPLDGYQGEYYSFQMNLPSSIHKKKLQALAEKFEQEIGHRARAHRAGRYGIAPISYEHLASSGIQFDFSPSPGFDQSPCHGPDFAHMSNIPFEIETDNGSVWVTPVCGARGIIFTQKFLPQSTLAPGFAFPPNRRSQLSKAMRLSCEGTSFEDLRGLTQQLVADNTPVLTYSLHSTSLTAGINQYSPNEEAIAQQLALTERYFEYFKQELGGTFITVDDVSDLYGR